MYLLKADVSVTYRNMRETSGTGTQARVTEFEQSVRAGVVTLAGLQEQLICSLQRRNANQSPTFE